MCLFASSCFGAGINIESVQSQIESCRSELISPLTAQGKRNSAALLKYEKILPNLTADGLKFMSELLETFKLYQNKELKAVVERYGDLTGDGADEKLLTYVHVVGDDVVTDAGVISNGKVIWSEQRKNPYLFVDDTIISLEESDPWIRFHIAITSDLPGIIDPLNPNDYFDSMAAKQVVRLGGTDTKEDYKRYIDNFNGKMLLHGDPECCQEALVWFEPIKSFIVFYSQH